MADKGTDSRLKLTITEVGARQSVGDKGAVKLLFYAREKEAEKALPYFTFSSRLFETIEQGKGKEIDCEVNVSTREWERDGDIQHFTDRKVTQIYVDGLPIGGQKRQWNQDSPETRASIEAQKRADITAQLWMADKFNEKTPEVIKMRKWLMGDATPPAKVTPKQKTDSQTVTQAKVSTTPTEPEEDLIFAEEETEKPKEPPKTIQALYNWISSHGRKYGRSWFLDNFSYTEIELRDPAKVEAAYYEVLQITGREK